MISLCPCFNALLYTTGHQHILLHPLVCQITPALLLLRVLHYDKWLDKNMSLHYTNKHRTDFLPQHYNWTQPLTLQGFTSPSSIFFLFSNQDHDKINVQISLQYTLAYRYCTLFMSVHKSYQALSDLLRFGKRNANSNSPTFLDQFLFTCCLFPGLCQKFTILFSFLVCAISY